jgi:dTDP-4-amino-4,6-dideoxygalactose transaminase
LSNWKVPLSDLAYGPEEDAAVARVLRSRWLSMGPEVQAFEKEFAEFLGVRHALAVANGTAALHLSYLALGIGTGDEVIQPAINFVAAANMTAAVGATAVFTDLVGLACPVISPDAIRRLVTPRTRAVVYMPYGGHPAYAAEVRAVCRQHGLAMVEDACHAVGAPYVEPAGKRVGTLGDIGCFSFFSNKNLAVGEGGMVVTDRDDLAERLRLLRSHGMTTLTWDRHKGHASSYDVVSHGYNYRLDEIRAALGRAQLQKLDAGNRRRKEHVALYRKRLAGLNDWVVPFADYGGDSAYHIMVVVAPNETLRERVRGALREARIQTSMHYPCIADFRAFAASSPANLDVSREFARRAVTLPLFPAMSAAQIEEICATVQQIAGANGAG